MADFQQLDIEIYYIDDNEVWHPLPYAFGESERRPPKFGWTLPDGVQQASFIFEMRTRYPKDYTVLGEPVHACGYLFSGIQNTIETEYTCFHSLTSTLDVTSTSATGVGTWEGACEVRLRIFDGEGNEYCTHGISDSGTSYDFERDANGNHVNHGRLWGSRRDGLYFCFDTSLDRLKNKANGLLSFTGSFDADYDELTYTLQVSDTPLFDEGLAHLEFHEIDGIRMDAAQATVSAFFTDGMLPSSDGGEVHLRYNKMYFCRARASDGFDYSEWCDVNGFIMVRNEAPTCVITYVDYPYRYTGAGGTHSLNAQGRYVEDPNGDYVASERLNGEMVVRFMVNDPDSKYVKAWLLFTMPYSTEDEKSQVPRNESTEPLSYDNSNSKTFMRALTEESLIRIPTNREIEVTWWTATEINKDVMRGIIVNDAYLYLFATDGVDEVCSAPYHIAQIDNSKLTNNLSEERNTETMYVNGSITWIPVYPLLPDTMQRMLMAHTLDEETSDAQDGGGGPTAGDGDDSGGGSGGKAGSIGYAEEAVYSQKNGSEGNGEGGGKGGISASSWYTLYSGIENALGKHYLQRVTQPSGFTVYRYEKYNKSYESYSELKCDDEKLYPRVFGDITYRKSGAATEYKAPFTTDENNVERWTDGSESTDPNYAHPDTIMADGFVSFCPYCDTLQILKTFIVLADGSKHYDTYQLDENGNIVVQNGKPVIVRTALVDAFGEDGERFDGTPYRLGFKCYGCGREFPMEFRYHTHMASGVHGSTIKDYYAMWHGYSSGERFTENTLLQQQMKLYRKYEFDDIKEKWKEQWKLENGSAPKDEDCPYTWVKMAKMKFGTGQAIDRDDNDTSTNATFNQETFGFVKDDVYLKLDPRPEFDAYRTLVTPEAMSYQEGIYLDGAKLNASIEGDYMHDFEKQDGTTADESLTMDAEEGKKGDKALTRLATNGPWWAQPRVMYQFFEGATSISKAKDGYKGAGSGGGSEGGSEGSGDSGESDGQTATIDEGGGGGEWGVPDYRVIGVSKYNGVKNHALAVIKSQINNGCHHVIQRMSFSGNVRFPIIVTRGVNDRYRYVLNNDVVVEGSLLMDGSNEMFIDFPYDEQENSDDYIPYMPDEIVPESAVKKYTARRRNAEMTEFMGLLQKLLSPMFKFEEEDEKNNTVPLFPESFEFTMRRGVRATIENSDEGRNIDLVAKTMAFTVYGNTSLNVEGLKEARYTDFELSWCESSCYETLGMSPCAVHQTMRTLRQNLVEGEFPKNPDVEEDKDEDNPDVDDQNTYWYIARKNSKHKYDVQESPIDNVIEDFVPYSEGGTDEHGNETVDEYEAFGIPEEMRHLKYTHRKPSVKPASGEPMFTCYRDEVDENGYHFKFTPDDYRKTGRIFIRRYHVESCNPFPLEGYGYRNWIVVPIDGKPGRYRKKKVFNNRGACAVPKVIDVEVSPELPLVQEIGWFESEDENASPISHKRKQKKKEGDGDGQQQQQEEDDGIKKYQRLPDMTWRNKLLPKTCVVFDYVDISEAMCKNPFTPDGESPLNHICPINLNGGVYADIFRDRYGLYVLGAYDLTEQQKSLVDDTTPYEKEFYYVDETTSSTTVVVETLPNNYRPCAIDSPFDILKDESRSITAIDLTKKKKRESEEESDWKDFDYDTKSVDSYARYKGAWENKIQAPREGCELSQWTVEQFSPSFRGSLAIWEKYGYQPKNTLETYFKEDKDGVYKDKYIPRSSKLVHGFYEDPFTGLRGDPYIDYRLVGQIMTERYILSDKTFKKVDENGDYNLLPFLDYRLTGKIVYDVLPYFSGYPRSEHPKYATRPEPPYPYDRQWRIGGWQVGDRELFKDYNGDNEYLQVWSPRPGAGIDEMQDYGNGDSFLYLQSEWNSYNRLHWTMKISSKSFMCLVAQKMSMGSTVGAPFSVKTAHSYWDENVTINGSVTPGAWCMKSTVALSDMLDMTETVDSNGNRLFEDGSYYRFTLTAYSYNGGQMNVGTTISSREFTISKTAVSPATIVSTDYDPWTKKLKLTFRFDDELGRDYDIVGFKYLPNDYDPIPSGVSNGVPVYRKQWYTERDFITPGTEGDGTSILSGRLTDLKSNVLGRVEIPDELAILHTVTLNVSSLGMQSSWNMRVMLLSALSMDRKGLTLPVFTVKMWANEFLKPIEERMMSLQGYTSHWKWEDAGDGGSNGKWTYIEEPVRVMGSIQETQGNIDGITEEFESWFKGISKYTDISCTEGDIDAFEAWLKARGKWNAFYYSYFFDEFIEAHSMDGYRKEYESYIASLGKKKPVTEDARARKWINANGHDAEYGAWYSERRIVKLVAYRTRMNAYMGQYVEWLAKRHASSLPDAQVAFARENESAYRKHFGIPEPSEDDSTELAIAPSEALEFIEATSRQRQFIQHYSRSNTFADTRFLERALVMRMVFGVQTTGVWEFDYGATHGADYQSWLAVGSNSSLPLPDRYQSFLWDVANDQSYSGLLSELTISDIGRSLAFSTFLQSPAGNGTTYSQKWQSLNSTMSSLTSLLYRCMNEKTMLETDFRRNLVRQGYFCNGFVNNTPYDGKAVNTCFRWRVETRQYEGKVGLSQDSSTKSYGNYDDRYNMYYRFQMDFLDTFDSQRGIIPALDIVFIKDGRTDDCRILAGIDDSKDSARTTPFETDRSAGSTYVAQHSELLVDGDSTTSDMAKNDILDLQFTATFGIPKAWLPQVGNGIDVPEAWWRAWENDEPWTEAPSLDSYTPVNSDCKGTYYWRVAPYNIVERPVVDSMLGDIYADTIDGIRYAVIEPMFHSDEIVACEMPTGIWRASGTLRYPVWRRNSQSAPYAMQSGAYVPGEGMSESEGSSQYAKSYAKYLALYPNSSWLNEEMEIEGTVQFPTDRPRMVEYVKVEEQVETEPVVASYLVSNQYGARLADNAYGRYEPVDDTGLSFVNDDGMCMYRAEMDGIQCWFIGTNPKNSEVQNGDWLYVTSQPKPQLASQLQDRNGTLLACLITASYEETEDESETVKVPSVSYIQDNIGNFDTQWLHSGIERIKPCVIRFDSQYLMFAHKVATTVVNGNLSRNSCVITMSRGFSSDIFGEEGDCIPKYSYQTVGEFVSDGNRKAVSVENPCVVQMPDGTWRMYFNAFFFDGEKYYSKIYKADTTDFEDWNSISQVHVMRNSAEMTDYLQPNVHLSSRIVQVAEYAEDDIFHQNPTGYHDETVYTYHMYAVSTDHYHVDILNNSTCTTLKQLEGDDGITFEFIDEIHIESDGTYSLCSPSFVMLSETRARLYFSIESAANQNYGISCIIGSIDGTVSDGTEAWSTTVHLGNSRITVEKSDEPFVDSGDGRNTVEGVGRIFNGDFGNYQSSQNASISTYFNPCVIHDTLNGCHVLRMYYNTKGSPYLWSEGVLSKNTDVPRETVIRTDYLESYEWTYSLFYETPDCITSGRPSQWGVLPTYSSTQEGSGITMTVFPASPDRSAKVRVPISDGIDAFMIGLSPLNASIRCMAQGRWIGYDNVVSTEAHLMPETNSEADYSLEKYSPLAWIMENNLIGAYNTWVQDGESVDDNSTEQATRFIVATGNYPRYLWWSRKGPGIYRYVGYDAMSTCTWSGDTLQQP